MAPQYPSDDKTRISGSGFNFGAPPPPPQTGPYPQGGGQPAPPPQDLYRPPLPPDDMWLIVDLPGKAMEIPLRQGEQLTLGREVGQTIVVDDKTLSRKHLILQRLGERVRVQVLGLNGLVFNEQLYKSTGLDIPSPASFTVGKVPCRIKKKQLDSDATILMSDQRPARVAPVGQAPPPPPQQSPFEQRPVSPAFSREAPPYGGYAPPPPPQPPPYDPGRGASSFPFGNQPSSPFPPEEPQPFPFGTGQTTPTSYPPPMPSGPPTGYAAGSEETFVGREYEPQGPFTGKPQPDKSNKIWIIAGSATAAVLIIAAVLFFFLRGPADKVPAEKQEPAAVTTPAKETSAPATTPGTPPATSTQDNNLHGRIYEEAQRLLSEGNGKLACDYLKDIPAASAYRDRAVRLANQIGNCKLDD